MTNRMNELILEAPPLAAREVDLGHIEAVAKAAAIDLAIEGYFVGAIEPGDATRYEVVIVRTHNPHQPFMFASSFGEMFAWMGRPSIHPDYAQEHYVSRDRSPWTAVVYALFLNWVAEHMGQS